jgi:hypothetical protein
MTTNSYMDSDTFMVVIRFQIEEEQALASFIVSGLN